MKDLLNLEVITKTMDDLPIGVGIFQVQDPNDLKSIRYIFMNKIILYEMRKEREEVFGKLIIEVAPEAYEHKVGLQVIETYRNVAVDGGSVNLGMVEYSNEEVAGMYECSVHHIQDNYIYVMLRNVTELDQSRKELAEVNRELEERVKQRTTQLEQSRRELVEINKSLEKRVRQRTAMLEQKNKELEQFAYIASHDLQEPLRTISNYIQVINEDFEFNLSEEVINYLQSINKSTERMKILVSALLDFSRLGRNRKLADVDTKKIVTEVIDDLHQLIQLTNANLKVGNLPKLHAYETELRQTFQNLISNAIKFRKENHDPEIQINYKELENHHQFSISDNGIGIAAEHIDRIFYIFQKLHLDKKYGGYGIGLANCKKIVEIHSGTIWVESQTGKGSTFYFTISKQLEI
ncbi:sensor histidine kinase [Chondrinema litorale]|uniref:sensor histidine kinase n=1 Tax=Chondrinema litorale TaxID=2994555 RepID=UPI002542C250|nr:ATP-binding protein [Chondrinema litorale]UZR96338.1 ATP-binding protein [Chondrinema litorale]